MDDYDKMFDNMIEGFKSGRFNAKDWNFCIDINLANKKDVYDGYIMGTGAEQCAGCKSFSTREELVDLFTKVGARFIMNGVG